MLRFAVSALLITCSFLTRAQAQPAHPGASLGAALWAEIGRDECTPQSHLASCTSSGPRGAYAGGVAGFHLDLLHWLRIGLAGGLGYTAGNEVSTSAGERQSSRHWFVPLSLHSYWRVELGKRVTLWGGPELGIAVFVASQRTATLQSPLKTERSSHTDFLGGVAVGLDARLRGAWRLGIELGQAVLISAPRVAAGGNSLDLRAVTRLALVLRYL